MIGHIPQQNIRSKILTSGFQAVTIIINNFDLLLPLTL